VFGIIDFTAGYHQTPLHPDSEEYTAFITQYGLYEWNRVAMGLKGSYPFFQRSMANKVLAGCITHICEIYIDDVLLFGTTDKTPAQKKSQTPKVIFHRFLSRFHCQFLFLLCDFKFFSFEST